jgi:hypothetical protein
MEGCSPAEYKKPQERRGLQSREKRTMALDSVPPEVKYTSSAFTFNAFAQRFLASSNAARAAFPSL